MPFNEKITPDEQWLFTAILLVSISAFVALAFLMRNGHLVQFDHAVLNWFHKIKHPTLDHFFSSITWLGSLWVLLPLYIILTLFLSRYFENFEKLLGIGFWGTVLITYAPAHPHRAGQPRAGPRALGPGSAGGLRKAQGVLVNHGT